MATNNFFSWFEKKPMARELEDTRASWEAIERDWLSSPLSKMDAEEIASALVSEVLADETAHAAPGVISAMRETVEELVRAEHIGDIEVWWNVVEADVGSAVEFRKMMAQRKRWIADHRRFLDTYAHLLVGALREFLKALPSPCFGNWENTDRDTFGVPLIDLLDEPAKVIAALVSFPFANEALGPNLFDELRAVLRTNIFDASGIKPENASHSDKPVISPTAQEGKTARELLTLYLKNTPFATLLELPIPFSIPEESRFEHCHIVAGTGHGKTQFLQKMIFDDLMKAQEEGRSVVVIDSQGDLLRKISNLELFSPYVGGGLGERLMIIDPADVEYPVAMNLFDPPLARLTGYSPADRERVVNGVIELYETFFDALLGAELTQRQDVVFRYIARLMLTIPDATIHTLMELMENGRRFTPYMERLEGSAKRFFEHEFFSPSFSATKGQVSKRLWGVLSTPSFDRMFSQKKNKIDLFDALNSGKIILVNTAKDLLKDEGCRLFGRFFISQLVQATIERSAIPEAKRNSAFVYIDEAHEYFDDRIETVLNQARKFKVSLTLAHQNLDQLSPRLRAALLTNTSTKCVGGVSAKDARLLADELHTSVEFIDSMRRKGERTQFAAWVKHVTPSAIRLTVPLGFVERQNLLDEDDYEELIDRNRARYCGTIEPEALPPAENEPAPVAAPVRVVPPSPPSAPNTPPPPPAARLPVEQGKGGARHKYLQALVKELAEAHGLKATIEAPLAGDGEVDVRLERDGVLVAVEISVSTPLDHEGKNIAKCLTAGYQRVAVVLAKSRAKYAQNVATLTATIPEEDRGRVTFHTPETLPEYIASLAAPTPPRETRVKGYRVKVSHGTGSTEEARARRDAVAKVIAKSILKP
ncbi:MAG: ATP-binding protein [Bdellovibrionales bacterium]|nr:ATP-binding protein [Bdellovibrionales bacterium]